MQRSISHGMRRVAFWALLVAPIGAQNTSVLSQNGWFSDDTRADGTGVSAAGTNLISPTLTDNPEASSMAASSAFDVEIRNQIRFIAAPGTIPMGTHTGALHLRIGPSGSGKSQVSHRDTSINGHCAGNAAFGTGMQAQYSWMGDGAVSITAGLKLGVRTSEFGMTGVSSRTGENAWDKIVIYEPGNLNGGISDGVWRVENVDWDTGTWWFFDRTVGASTIGTPLTLQQMSTSMITVSGTKTIQDVYNLITAPGAVVTSVQFGIGSGNAGGSVYVNQLETNFYRVGETTTFGCDGYEQGFEVDDSGFNVFGVMFPSTRVMSGTNGITSAGGAWHSEAMAAATNWGGYAAVCGCSATSCAAGTFPVDGYRTSLDIYLDVNGGFANDTRFDFTSAVNNVSGSHLRDFVFNGGFYNAADLTGPGAGTNRFIFSTSNNAPGFPKGGISPIAIGSTGWYTFVHEFYNSGGALACRFSIRDSLGDTVVEWIRSNPADLIPSVVGGNRYGWFVVNQFPFLAIDNALYSDNAAEAELVLSAADCQDDANMAAGYHIAVELSMANIENAVTGFYASVAYDQAVLAYRGTLSSYTATPFPLHITLADQVDDGVLDLDGSVSFGDLPVSGDALLATLIFQVLDECDPLSPPVTFHTSGMFASELSLRGDAVATNLVDPAPFTLDDTAPILTPCPSAIIQAADASLVNSCAGAIVTYIAPTATDNCDPLPVVTCVPPSGSFFNVGSTMVTCTAVDDCGNQSSCQFMVTVTATNTVAVEVELAGVFTPVARCIHFVSGACVESDVVVSFTDHDMNPGTPVRGTALLDLACGPYDGEPICVKDEQHTKWNTGSLMISGDIYISVGAISLIGGDTDNDGDVDINDVTLLLAQFGQFFHPGGCAWNGTRDADFSNNGVIASEDYTFLTASWLTTSACACMLPIVGGGSLEAEALPVRVPVSSSALMRTADLNSDGWIDVKDVEVLEQRLDLGADLSRRMRTR
jgi:hypothetical protein